MRRAIITDGSVNACTELRWIGFGRNQVNNTTGCISTVQRTLRPTQRLNPLHIKELGLKDSSRDLVDTINVDAHARISEGTYCTRTDPAYSDITTGKVAFGLCQVGNRELHCRRIVNELRVQLFLSKS